VIFFNHLVVPRLHLLHLRGDLVGDDADDHREHEHAHEHDRLRYDAAAPVIVRRRVRARDVEQVEVRRLELFAETLVVAALPVQEVHQFVPQAAHEDDGDGQHEQTRHLAQQRQREHLLRLVREDLARAVLLVRRERGRETARLALDRLRGHGTDQRGRRGGRARRGVRGARRGGRDPRREHGRRREQRRAADRGRGERLRGSASRSHARLVGRGAIRAPLGLGRSVATRQVGEDRGRLPGKRLVVGVARVRGRAARHANRAPAGRAARHDAGAADRVGGLFTNNRRGDERASRSGRARGRDRARSRHGEE